jgi:hypothetical protein
MNENLRVFVVIEEAMHGLHCARVHRSHPKVSAGEAAHEVTVLGSQNDPEVVYIAQTYDRSNYIHNFAGVYGNYDEARLASGAKGSARPIKIEA